MTGRSFPDGIIIKGDLDAPGTEEGISAGAGPSEEEAATMTQTDVEEFKARVSAHGNSLNINCTQQIKRMGLGRGDLVQVRLERIAEQKKE